MSNSRFAIFAVTFAAVYAAVYYFAVDYNWALFSYAPATGQWTLLTHTVGDGPMMYWYGWIATSAIAGTVAGLIACCLPGNPGKRLWSGLAWLAPICSFAAIAHLLSGYFTR
jgi:hypothetical protein